VVDSEGKQRHGEFGLGYPNNCQGFVQRILQDATGQEKPYKAYDCNKIKLIVRNYCHSSIDGLDADG
jgi:hypothetical protein